MKKKNLFPMCCVLFLCIFTLFMIWYIPSMSSLAAKTEETRQSLETSRGRENKQQSEYDKAMEELPLVREQLLEITPLAEQAEETVAMLKARRKELRAEKSELEQQLAGGTALQEDGNNE